MEHQYVGAGRRFVASLLDSVILGVAYGFISIASIAVLPETGAAIAYVIYLAGSIAYVVVYQAKTGQTLGKKVMSIKVVDAQGHTPGMLTFFLREILGKAVSGIIFGIGYLVILWDKNKQGLHDKIASTFVVRV